MLRRMLTTLLQLPLHHYIMERVPSFWGPTISPRTKSFDSFCNIVHISASWWYHRKWKIFCNYNLSVIMQDWRALLFQFCFGKEPPQPLFYVVLFFPWSMNFLLSKKVEVLWNANLLNQQGNCYVNEHMFFWGVML